MLLKSIMSCIELGLDHGTIHNILVNNNIPILRTKDIMAKRRGKPVNMMDTEGNFIRKFATRCDAAKFILKEKNLPSSNYRGIAGHIKEVCNGKRKIAYGYTWSDAFS